MSLTGPRTWGGAVPRPCDGPGPRGTKPEDTKPQKRLHGRRQGRPLRGGLRMLLERRLPAMEIELPDRGQLDPAALFSRPPRALWLEIGFGGGEHLAWQAEQNPDVGLIGCEVFLNGIATLLRALDEAGSRNVRLFRDDARLLLDVLPEACLERVFLLFPDPWPKRRHAKRRFVSPATLDALARLLADDGELRVASDDPTYQAWALAHLLDHAAFDWTARRADDWRYRPADWPETRYETKALEADRKPIYLSFRRLAREMRARTECP